MGMVRVYVKVANELIQNLQANPPEGLANLRPYLTQQRYTLCHAEVVGPMTWWDRLVEPYMVTETDLFGTTTARRISHCRLVQDWKLTDEYVVS